MVSKIQTRIIKYFPALAPISNINNHEFNDPVNIDNSDNNTQHLIDKLVPVLRKLSTNYLSENGYEIKSICDCNLVLRDFIRHKNIILENQRTERLTATWNVIYNKASYKVQLHELNKFIQTILGITTHIVPNEQIHKITKSLESGFRCNLNIEIMDKRIPLI